MKKRLFLIAAAALALVACAKEEAYEPEVVVSHKGVKVTIGASFEELTNGTKSDYTAGGDFYWSTGDAIWIGTDWASGKNNWGYGSIITDQTNKGPGYAIADFDCILTGGTTTAVAAVFPFESVTPSYTAGSPLGTLSLTLKNTISWANSSGLSDDLKKEIYDRNKGLETTDPKYVSDIKFMQADNVMVARYEDIYTEGYPQGTTTGLQFYNVGGVFCLTLNNIPPGAEKLVFTTDKKITGTFPVSNVEVNSNNYPQIDTEATETEAEKSVTIEFETITSSLNTRVFFIPVPVGSYVIGFDTQDHDGNSLWKFSAARANTVERGHIVKMPALTHVVVSGGGDSATNIITTPTGCNETVYLPSTESNIYVRMNQTGGTITLAYSTIEGAKHPANVYLEALGDIENLNINLPDSHVELKGSGNVAQVITNVTSYTSYATLKVANTVKIGKAEAENSGLTVTGGSLDLEAPVEGKVKVDIPETVLNTTEEKVSINIASSIKKLDVKRAANQEAANKIYVTIAQAAKVKDSLAVPETNCNLYVANGAEVKVVETKATENTVEGKVETLAASGESTVVTVTKAGSVTESITSADKATVVIEDRTVQEVADGDAGEIVSGENVTTLTNGSVITVDGTVVAYIGSTPYTSLQAAIAAAQAGDEIVIQASHTVTCGYTIDKNLTINLNGNTITANAASDEDANFPNNRLFKVTGSANLTVKNGTTVLNDKLWGSVRFESTGNLVLTDYVTYNYREYGANIKMSHGNATFTNVKIYADKGGCVDIGDGSYDAPSHAVAEMTNCTFEQTGEGSTGEYKTVSTAVIVSCSGHVTLNSGSYSGYYGLFPHSSGGTITVKDGCTITGRENAVHTVDLSTTYINIHEDHIINIQGGTINGTFDVATDGHTTFSITGGTFDHDPTAFVAEGYEAVDNGNGTWTVQEGAYVARIGETKYETLTAAIAAAQANETVTLIKDVVLTESLVIAEGKNLTLDLGTHSISGAVGAGTEAQSVEGKLIVNNGNLTINSSNNQGRIWNNGRDAQGRDAIYNAEGATIVINGGIFGDSDTDMTNGNNINRGLALRNYGTATINGGLFTAGDNYLNSGWAYAVINAGTSTLTINGGTVYGKNNGNIGATSGELIVNGGTFKIDGPKSHYNIYAAGGNVTVNNGTFIKSDYVSNGNPCSFYAGSNGQIVINNGTFNNLTNSVFKESSGTGTVSVTGGTFNKQPEAAIIADGYAAVDNGNGTWTVSEVNYVAQIGSAKYQTVAAAVAAANETDNAIITLLSDVTEDEGWIATKSMTLDLNGYNYTLVGTPSITATAEYDGNTFAMIAFRPSTAENFVLDATKGGQLSINSNSAPEGNHKYIGFLASDGEDYCDSNDNPIYVDRTISCTINGKSGTKTIEVGDNIKYGLLSSYRNSASTFTLNTAKVTSTKTEFGGVLVYHANIGNAVLTNSTITTAGQCPVVIGDSCQNEGENHSVGTVTNCDIRYTGTGYDFNRVAIQVTSGAVVNVYGGTYEGPAVVSIATSGGTANLYSGTFNGTTKRFHTYGTGGYESWASDAIYYDAENCTFPGSTVDQTVGASDIIAPFAAEIGTTRYASLAAAVEAVPTDGTKTTIRMIANETMATGASITIAATQNVVLDLNSKTVTGNGGLNGANFFLLTNKGSLEVTDLSSGKTGKLTGYWTSPNTGYSNQYVTIYNAGGNLTLTAGTVETTSGYLSYAINNTSNAWGVGDDKESVFNMTGGTLTASNGGDAALRVYQNCADTANPFSHNYVTISGGTIASGGIFLDNYIYHPHENTTGEGIITNVTITGGEIHGLIDMKLRHAFHTSINISGGTFLQSKLRVRKVNNSTTDRWDPSIENPSSPVFNISGGNFTFVNGGAFGLNYGYSGTDWSSYIPYSVTGGTFSVDPTTFVAPGYAATGNGPWTVVEAPITVGTGGQYETLAEGVAAVANGGTIKLVSDINVNSSITLPRSLTLDLNGNTITSSAVLFNIYSNYNLTIKDSGENGVIDAAADKIIYSSNSGSKIKIEGGNLSTHSTSSNTYGVCISSGASFEMTGGSITIPSTSTSKLNNVCVYNSGNGTITISGGTLDANASGPNYTISSGSVVNITGGIISGHAASISSSPYAKYPYVLYGSGTYNISGGFIKAIGWENWGQSAHFFGNSTNASITGGLFGGVDIEDANSRAEVSSRVASGYTIVNLTSSDAEYANGYRYKVVAQ